MGFIGITSAPDTTSSGSSSHQGNGSDMNHSDKACNSSSSLASSLSGNSSSKILNVAPSPAPAPAGPVNHLRPGRGKDGIVRISDAAAGVMTSVKSSNACPGDAMQKNHQQLLAYSVAHFLLTRKGLSKQMIGQYLGNLQNSFNQLVLDHFLQGIELSGLFIDEALRKVNI